VNLIPQMPTVRNQESRGTCVAHAALASYEHYLYVQGAYQDLSEQFLYWNCKRNDGIPNLEGTWLAIAIPLLQREGCCLETTWSYIPLPVPGNEGQGPPPGGAQLEALTFRVPGYKQLSPTFVDDIKNELAAGRCVPFSVPVFNSWLRSQWVAYSGDITMPVPNEVRVGGHAMCFVGYVDRPNPGLGGGRFILRNSWGTTNWGINSSYGAGYGTIPYAYIARMGAEAYSIS
jgi:C1A family cysteine protease